MGIGLMTYISIKQSKTNYLDGNGSGVKPKTIFTKTGIRYSFSYDPIHKIWNRDRKKRNNNIGRGEINWTYLYSWVQIPRVWRPF